MEVFEKVLFEEVLNMAVSRFSERIVQRCAGTQNALTLLAANCEGEGVWLGQFIDNFLVDNLLNNVAGAAFILQALERQKITGIYEGPVGEVVQAMAREVFAELVQKKTLESLERAIACGDG